MFQTHDFLPRRFRLSDFQAGDNRTSAQNNSRIGIVLVHGIGEQRRFEHLSGEVRELVKTLQEMQDQKLISGLAVRPRESQDATYLGEHLIWKAEGQAPLRIDFTQDGVSKTLCIHEVWWADLDIKNANLMAKIKFWLWALGSWGSCTRTSCCQALARLVHVG